MKKLTRYTLAISGVVFTIMIFTASFFSYQIYIASKRIEKDLKRSVGELEQDVKRLKTELAAMKSRQENRSNQNQTKAGAAATMESKKDAVGKEHTAIRRLEDIVESTGLEQLAANQNMDPTVLSEIYEEYADRKQVRQRREKLLEKNGDFHKADADQYGDELMALYERARWRRGAGTERQDSDSAFAELLAKYPEAYATGMSVAERALDAGFRRKTSEVVKYYKCIFLRVKWVF